MHPQPQSESPDYKAAGKLKNKVAIVTGADSGIGRAEAILFAKEGAKVMGMYLNEHEDAADSQRLIKKNGGQCSFLAGDIGDEEFCRAAVGQCVKKFGRIDILVNNAGEQQVKEDVREISREQLEQTFRTNIYSMFYLVQASLDHMPAGSAIVNTTSVTAYRGSDHLLDYSATKGAIVSFTRSLAKSLAKKNIRVNAVAPGPVWTPLITSTFPQDDIAEFGSKTAMERPAEPFEIAPCYVFLASSDSSYMTGQVLHPNGGEIVNG